MCPTTTYEFRLSGCPDTKHGLALNIWTANCPCLRQYGSYAEGGQTVLVRFVR